jgi:prepilin-type N-terminal cleavage/methylation domain-containing protein
MKSHYLRGFTLIELLVVIAIIGILSSIVLASLSTARAKGADAAVKSNLNTLRSLSELFYSNSASGSYLGACADTTATGLKRAHDAAVVAGANGGACADAATYWVAWAGLKTNTAQAWCVDNTGSARAITKPTGAITVCP